MRRPSPTFQRCEFVGMLTLAIFANSLCSRPALAQGAPSIQIDASGIHIYSQELSNQYLAGTNFLQGAHTGGIMNDPQMLMAMELARASQRNVNDILAYRSQKLSWYDILQQLNVSPSLFYPQVDVGAYGAPYADAYDCYRSGTCGARQWSDDDLQRLAAVKLISETTHQPAPEVIRIYREHPKLSFYSSRSHAPAVVVPNRHEPAVSYRLPGSVGHNNNAHASLKHGGHGAHPSHSGHPAHPSHPKHPDHPEKGEHGHKPGHGNKHK